MKIPHNFSILSNDEVDDVINKFKHVIATALSIRVNHNKLMAMPAFTLLKVNPQDIKALASDYQVIFDNLVDKSNLGDTIKLDLYDLTHRDEWTGYNGIIINVMVDFAKLHKKLCN